MIVVASGLIGSGKDTVAEYLEQKYGFHHVSFADSLKQALSAVFGWPEDMLLGRTPKSRAWREQIDEWWSERLQIPALTPRWVMQNWGTDVLRNHFHQDIWIASLERRLQDLEYDVVISDCRFANEIQSIRNQHGILIRVNRGEKPVWYDTALDEINYLKTYGYETGFESKMKAQYPSVHVTEWGWIGEKFDYEIDNTETLAELYKKVNDIILKIR